MTERSPYTLNPVQLEKAVQALQKAAETLGPKPNEERLYRRLGICVLVAVAVFAGALLAGVAFFMVVARAGGTETALFYVFLLLMGGFGVLFVLAAVCATLLLLLNHSVIRQAFRQRLLLKKLGIREVSLSAWKVQRRGHGWSKLAGAVLTGVGIVSLVLGVLGSSTMWMSSKKEDLWIAVFYVSLFFAFGVTVLIWRFVQRSREQWAIVGDANRLRSALKSMQTKAGGGEEVVIPAGLVEHAAQIEGVSIAQERRDAVMASAATTDRGYGIVVARDVSSQKRSLDPQQRIAVENLFENLSSNPRPAGTESTPEGRLSVRTTEGNVELQYTVDEEAKRVHIVTLTAHHHG